MQHEATATAKAPADEKVVPFVAEPRAGRDVPYSRYQLGQAYDEMFTAEGRVRPHYAALAQRVARLPTEELNRRQLACEQSFLHQGITQKQPGIFHPLTGIMQIDIQIGQAPTTITSEDI